MATARELPQDDRRLREMVRQAREAKGLLPRQLAAAAGVQPYDVEFIETHGVAPTASMLQVLQFLGIEDYESVQLARLSQLIPDNAGESILMALVEGGYKEVETIDHAAEVELAALPWVERKQLERLRRGLEIYRQAERIDDADEA